MTKLKKVAGKSLATLGVAGLAVAGIAGAAAAAVGPDQPDHPETGSLTIHKVAGTEDESASNNGSIVDPTPGTPIAGVEFTVWQLGKTVDGECVAIDLTDTDQWENIPDGTAPADIDAVEDAGFCVASAGDDVLSPNPAIRTTDGSGEIELSSLGLGLYYVAETNVEGANIDGTPVKIDQHAVPFYVTVPLANDGDWIYDVHAYPKNVTKEIPEKTINETEEQTGYVVGDTVQYTITQTVPTAKNPNGVFTQASIYDNLGLDLGYDSTVSVKINGNDVAEGPNGYQLVRTTNAAGHDIVTWELRGKTLTDLKVGDTFEVVFNAVVKRVTDTGEIENPGSDINTPGYGSSFDDEKIPGEKVPYTYWGELTVNKVDQKNKALAGAEFQVTALTAPATACPATVGTQTVYSTGVSGTDGIVRWSPNTPNNSSPLGLFVANSNDGPLTDPSKVYCMYETKVPAGYTGVGVQTLTIKPGTENALTVDIENEQKTPPTLPTTGANGTTLMVIGGVALVALAGGLYLVNRRKVTNG